MYAKKVRTPMGEFITAELEIRPAVAETVEQAVRLFQEAAAPAALNLFVLRACPPGQAFFVRSH